MGKESQIQKRIIKALNRLQHSRFFKVVQGRYSEAGIPDIIGCYRGAFVALEVKSLLGKPTAKQQFFLNQIDRCGGYSAIVRSVEDAMEIINAIDERNGA